ncbi:MAG: macro domain-containing protein [candidate division NC10 bacterium]|nr:macro domain-containing protein [candidate division NC10 bacterium]
MLTVEIRQGSLLEADAEAIVNAANSQGWMGGGVAGAIKRAAGRSVEEEAVAAAPIPIGSAAVTSGGKTRFRGIVHAPTMEQPAVGGVPKAAAAAAMCNVLRTFPARRLQRVILMDLDPDMVAAWRKAWTAQGAERL